MQGWVSLCISGHLSDHRWVVACYSSENRVVAGGADAFPNFHGHLREDTVLESRGAGTSGCCGDFQAGGGDSQTIDRPQTETTENDKCAVRKGVK